MMRPLTPYLAVAALFFANCSPAECAPVNNKASQILTADMAAKMLGGEVQANSCNSESDTTNGATWVSRSYFSKKGGIISPSLGLLIRHAANKAEAKKIFESSKSTFSGETVAGLGDAAYRTKSPPQLNVLKGSNWLILSAGTFSKPDTAAQEKLAKEILPKVQD
jgi:hypothetical protein